jgi:hypothetical protein
MHLHVKLTQILIYPPGHLSHVLIIFIPIGINSKDVYIALNPVQKCRDTDLQGIKTDMFQNLAWQFFFKYEYHKIPSVRPNSKPHGYFMIDEFSVKLDLGTI